MDWPLCPLLCCDLSQRPHILQDAIAWSPSSGLVFISFPLGGFHIVSRPWFWQLSDMGLFCSPSSGLLGHPPAYLLHPPPPSDALQQNCSQLTLLLHHKIWVGKFFSLTFSVAGFTWMLPNLSLSPPPTIHETKCSVMCDAWRGGEGALLQPLPTVSCSFHWPPGFSPLLFVLAARLPPGLLP